MSEVSEGGAKGPGLFSARVVAAMVAVGALSFLAFLWLTAYSPDLKSGRDGGAHALSNAATGFRGLGDLLEDVGGRAVRVRNSSALRRGGLLVLTPTSMTDPKLLAKIVDRRAFARTLIILPKWNTTPLKAGRKGWVSGYGTGGVRQGIRVVSDVVDVLGGNQVAGVKRGMTQSGIIDTARVPAQVQTIAGKAIVPLVLADNGGVLVAQVKARPRVYIAADPDLFNNMGLKDLATARAAIGLMDHITEAADRNVTFDLTLNGFEQSSNLLKLAFEPPFLAATLCLLLAALLAALGAFFPFGPAIREARAISFGKRALVDNSADLLVGAGRYRLIGGRYAALIRDAAAARLGLAVMPAEDTAEHLSLLGTSGGKPFAALAGDAEQATSRTGVAHAAAALHRWKKEVLA